MKKINLVVLVIFCVSFYGHSQIWIAPQLTYGTETEFGLGVKSNFGFKSSALEISPDVSYYFGKKTDILDYSLLSANLNAHYRFKKEEKLSYYPLAGINVSFINVNSKRSVDDGVHFKANPHQKRATTLTPTKDHTEVGLNLGLGVNYKISPQLHTFFEAKYIASGLEQAVVHIGLLFSL